MTYNLGISSAAVVGILFVVLVIFVLIVLFVFRMHSKRMNRELRETRIELSRRKCSDESYADVKDIYDDPNLIRKSIAYESVNYEEVEDHNLYQLKQHSDRSQPQYLYIHSGN